MFKLNRVFNSFNLNDDEGYLSFGELIEQDFIDSKIYIIIRAPEKLKSQYIGQLLALYVPDARMIYYDSDSNSDDFSSCDLKCQPNQLTIIFIVGR